MIHDFLHRFLDIWLDMAPWLLVGFALAFLCSYLLSERWLRRHLGGPGWLPILKASLVGLPLPICSCGVLVVGLALRKSGARKAPVCAFLASAPQAGTDALLPSWAILGPALTVLRFVGAFAVIIFKKEHREVLRIYLPYRFSFIKAIIPALGRI